MLRGDAVGCGRSRPHIEAGFQGSVRKRFGEGIGTIGQLGRLGCLQDAMVAHDSSAGHAICVLDEGSKNLLVDSWACCFRACIDRQGEL